MDTLRKFKVVYVDGVHPDVIVEEKNELEAMKEGLAILRGEEALVDLRPIEKVVKYAKAI